MFYRPVESRPTGVGLAGLPILGDIETVRRGEDSHRGAIRLLVGGRGAREPGSGFGPKLGLLGRVVEVQTVVTLAPLPCDFATPW